MKTIVAGTRTFNDSDIIFEEISWVCANKFLNITEVVCGMAKGPDLIGRDWAIAHNIPVKEFPADWKNLGLSAGIIRNHEMGDYADFLIAFWDGISKGTADMIKYMNRLKKPVHVYRKDVDNDKNLVSMFMEF